MTEQPRRVSGSADALPPVEPPPAGFLVQLFVVPLTIVACGLFVVWGFYWLAQMGNDPESYVRALRRNNEGRWQVALNFANDLRGPGGAVLKNDPALAGELAAILADEVASGRPAGSGHAAEQSRTLCAYLCRALGEFAVPEAAAPLLARAGDTSDPGTAQAAVEALAVLASNLAALDRLQELLDDGEDDVRFNAAVGLARHGGAVAWDTLGEMLDLPDVGPAAAEDRHAAADRYRRAMVVVNALKGVGLIIDATSAAPPEAIARRVAALAADPVSDVRAAAVALQRRIERLGAS